MVVSTLIIERTTDYTKKTEWSSSNIDCFSILVRRGLANAEEERGDRGQAVSDHAEHEEVLERDHKVKLELEAAQDHCGQLLPDGDAAIENRHLHGHTPYLARQFCFLVPLCHHTEGETTGRHQAYVGEYEREDCQAGVVSHDEGAHKAHECSDNEAWRVHQVGRDEWSKNSDSHKQKRKGQIEIRAILTCSGEVVCAMGVRQLRQGALGRLRIARVHAVREPLLAVVSPHRVPEPSHGLHEQQNVESNGHSHACSAHASERATCGFVLFFLGCVLLLPRHQQA